MDHGGAWEFTAVVNEVSATEHELPATLAEATVPFVLQTDQVHTGTDPDEEIKADAGEVAFM